MFKRIINLIVCFALILSAAGCSGSPESNQTSSNNPSSQVPIQTGVEFSGEDIWSQPPDSDHHQGTQTRLEKAITSKDADKLTVGFEPIIEDKALILDFQKWLSQMKLSPISGSSFSHPEGSEVYLFGLWAKDEEFFSLSISDSGTMVFSFGMAYSYASFYNIDNFEDIRADYEKLIERIEEVK